MPTQILNIDLMLKISVKISICPAFPKDFQNYFCLFSCYSCLQLQRKQARHLKKTHSAVLISLNALEKYSQKNAAFY